MGTMIQRHKFDEAAFRGARFAAHGKLVQGNNDLLVLTQPEAIAEIHEGYLAAGADIISHQHLQCPAHLARRLRHGGAWPTR